jgi:hypothetical protein
MSVGGRDATERNEIDRNGKMGGPIRVDQSLQRSPIRRELTGPHQSFFDESKLFPTFDRNSEIDVAGGATGAHAINVRQDEITCHGARHEVRASRRACNRVQ